MGQSFWEKTIISEFDLLNSAVMELEYQPKLSFNQISNELLSFLTFLNL